MMVILFVPTISVRKVAAIKYVLYRVYTPLNITSKSKNKCCFKIFHFQLIFNSLLKSACNF